MDYFSSFTDEMVKISLAKVPDRELNKKKFMQNALKVTAAGGVGIAAEMLLDRYAKGSLGNAYRSLDPTLRKILVGGALASMPIAIPYLLDKAHKLREEEEYEPKNK
jgi:hypothetical protein